MSRDAERKERARQAPIIGGLPDVPGIFAAMRLSPALGVHLRGLADEMFVAPFQGATLTRGERELIATAVAGANDCFYCMDSHGAFACELLRRDEVPDAQGIVDTVKAGGTPAVSDKVAALLRIARIARDKPLRLTRADVERALEAGATDADTQLTIFITGALSMYCRLVDGLRAITPATAEAYRLRAAEIADHGYSDPRAATLPR